jgi:hypothetical protein
MAPITNSPDPASLQKRYHELRALEDGGTRGGRTWNAYIGAMQALGEGLCEAGCLGLRASERLASALAMVELLRPMPWWAIDDAVRGLRQCVDAADLVVST